MSLNFAKKGLFTSNDLISTNSKAYTCTGIQFSPHILYSDKAVYFPASIYTAPVIEIYDLTAFTTVNLPDGVTLTSAIVYGSNTAMDWDLYRTTLSTGVGEKIVTGKVGTEVLINSKDTVDNLLYGYYLVVSFPAAHATHQIYGAQVNFSL